MTKQVKKFFSGYFIPHLDEKIAKSAKLPTYMRRRPIVNGTTLAEVVKGCDTYVAKKILPGPMINGVLRNAKWRSDSATDAQKKYVKLRWSNRKLTKSTDNNDDEERIRKLTKGEAANIITRLKHGAQTRYEKKLKTINKVNRTALNEQMRLAKYRIRVGSLASQELHINPEDSLI